MSAAGEGGAGGGGGEAGVGVGAGADVSVAQAGGGTAVVATAVVAARRRSRPAVAIEDVARGAPGQGLDQPAATFLEAMPWSGPSPDPDVLDAVTFLAWL
jgi:hypothetical protein